MSNRDDPPAVDSDPFVHLTTERAISLRWTLRDVLANRTKFLSVADSDLQLLAEMGLVEMHGDAPTLTTAGIAVID